MISMSAVSFLEQLDPKDNQVLALFDKQMKKAAS